MKCCYYIFGIWEKFLVGPWKILPEQLKVWRKIRNVREKISGKMYGKKSSKITISWVRVAPQMPPQIPNLAPSFFTIVKKSRYGIDRAMPINLVL